MNLLFKIAKKIFFCYDWLKNAIKCVKTKKQLCTIFKKHQNCRRWQCRLKSSKEVAVVAVVLTSF